MFQEKDLQIQTKRIKVIFKKLVSNNQPHSLENSIEMTQNQTKSSDCLGLLEKFGFGSKLHREDNTQRNPSDAQVEFNKLFGNIFD